VYIIDLERIGMNKIVQFAKDSYAELRKVVWPSREDVTSSVKVVIVSTVVIAAVLGFIDAVLLFGVNLIF
jgi:preprotein translocase subunit SecE